MFNSLVSEMPLWFVSCHSRSEEKIVSPLSILPLLLPPSIGLSYSASAINPFGLAEEGCRVKLPNNSVPLSIEPLPLRSRASHESSDPLAVQPSRSAVPSPLISKSTPLAAFVRSNPFPCVSITIGLGGRGIVSILSFPPSPPPPLLPQVRVILCAVCTPSDSLHTFI